MEAITDTELVSDLAVHQARIADRDTTPADRMASMRTERTILKELNRRAALRMRNQPPTPPAQPFDLDTFERERGYTRD